MDFSKEAYESSDKVKIIQDQKLQKLLVYLSQHSPFYKELFAKHKVILPTFLPQAKKIFSNAAKTFCL